jgi:hypothetical protein
LNQKRQWLTFQSFVSNRKCSGLHFNTSFKSETAVPHVPTLCFDQKLPRLIFERCVSAYCRV